MRTCSRCRERKQADCFRKKGSICKECHNAEMRRHYAKPETKLANRNRSLLKKYGITAEEFDALLSAQDGRCAICGTRDPKGPWNTFVVDHDHYTGKVRGLLCNACNQGIGHFKDSVVFLTQAAKYLSIPTLERMSKLLEKMIEQSESP